MRRLASNLLCAAGVCLILAACGFAASPASVSYQGEPATVAALELLWPSGEGMGAFVDATTPTAPPAGGGLLYRITVLFDDGQRTYVTQDASTPLAVGTRVRIESGRVVPHPSEDSNSNIQRVRF